MTKKLFFIFIFFLSFWNGFCLDTQIDVIGGGFYNYTKVNGSASYEEYSKYNYHLYNGDYEAIYKAGGGFLGFDLFFNECPLGLYLRAGLMGVNGIERSAGGKIVKLDNTEVNYNMFYDLGSVYNLALNKYVSFCVSPALSLIFINSEYFNLDNIYKSRASSDSLFGVGVTADIYAKFRYKYFVATAGCTASFYPLALVSSSDSAINYNDVSDTMAFNIRPYIALGVTFRESNSLKITPAN